MSEGNAGFEGVPSAGEGGSLSPNEDKLEVAVDARLFTGEFGGVEQVIIGLAHGLSSLEDGNEHYSFVVYEGHDAWLKPYIHGPCSLVQVPVPSEPVTWKHRLVRQFPRLAALRRKFVRAEPKIDRSVPPTPHSDGFIERLGCDVVHFAKQDGFITSIPSIYHPHDLQHRHLPEFFEESERMRRDLWYGDLCRQASMVSVTSQWGKSDLVQNFGLPPEKIEVIPLAPAITAYSRPDVREQEGILQTLHISQPFMLYPAQTWRHKNHGRLLHALARLREAGLDVSLVCSGRQNELFPEIRSTVQELGIQDAVTFVGFVEPRELETLYARARCLVMPTLFEAAGGFGPIAEAFAVGTPVCCSNVTSLPEQVGDAAVVFDPYDIDSIADAMEALWTDPELREALAARGRERIGGYSWDRVARTFRAHYRRIGGRQLSQDDQRLLARPTDF